LELGVVLRGWFRYRFSFLALDFRSIFLTRIDLGVFFEVVFVVYSVSEVGALLVGSHGVRTRRRAWLVALRPFGSFFASIQ
jgi:hypothetical protein